MTDDHLHVELVAADRTVWSGSATMVIARTTEGDVGVLRGHAPMLSLLTDAVVEIVRDDEGEVIIAAADGGFLSVAGDRVSILSEHVVLSEDIDIDEARAELETARGLLPADEAERRLRRAEARIRAVEKAR